MRKYCVSCAQMKILEQNTDKAGLTYYEMMENAGTSAANRIVEITMSSPINDVTGDAVGDEMLNGDFLLHDQQHVSMNDPAEAAERCYAFSLQRPVRARIYCGKGNNGGDGFVVARKLHALHWEVEIVLVDGEPVTDDAITNCRLARSLKIPVTLLADMDDARTGRPVDVIVDAIYGTGFHGQLRGSGVRAAAQIAAARERGSRVFALDIPSGMGGDLTDEAELDPRCVRADVTITFHAKKPVHLQPFAKKYCGRIITADIGIVDPDRDAAMAAAEQEAAGSGNAGAPRTFDLADNETYTFDDFVEIVSRLRAPDGCPWDREQTHQTLKKYLLEETQELANAIDSEDDDNFCEELGDVLLQIVLHAQLARERGAFTMDNVIQRIAEKMIRRHPWVFGDLQVTTPEEGERLWEQIKAKEKNKDD